MRFTVGAKIVSKKPHACGANEWLIVRTGADVKMKCLKCGRVVFLTIDDAEKITKKYLPAEEENNG